nr:hypothetical protein [uncultured Dyadobacter sp.]
MKLRHLILGCSLIFAENALGQRAALIYSSADIDTMRPDSSVRNVWPQKFGKYMRIKYKTGVKAKVPKDAVWGFRDKKGNLFRMYKGMPYRVVKNGEYVKYYYEDLIYIEPTLVPSIEARYSATLDSPIVFTKRKARRK